MAYIIIIFIGDIASTRRALIIIFYRASRQNARAHRHQTCGACQHHLINNARINASRSSSFINIISIMTTIAGAQYRDSVRRNQQSKAKTASWHQWTHIA